MNEYTKALLEQHILLEKAVPEYERQIASLNMEIQQMFHEKKADKLIFIGMGSSLYAAQGIVPVLNECGIQAYARNGYVADRYMNGGADEKAIVFLITQSGNTPEILRTAQKLTGKTAKTIAVINNENCAVKDLVDENIYLKMGEETYISNKTYYAQTALLAILVDYLTGSKKRKKEVLDAIEWYKKLAEEWDTYVEKAVDYAKDAEIIDLLGDDAQEGVAFQSGLVWRELSMLKASAFSLSDYNHGWFEISRLKYLAVIFTDHIMDMEKEVIERVLERKGKVLVFSSDSIEETEGVMQQKIPNVSREVLPLYSIAIAYFIATKIKEDSDEVSGN